MFLKRIQLGLLHVAVAMTLVPINGTLNRVMIKELGFSAALVALMASLPYLFSPIQVAIGSFSDRHPIWGWRRSPYILIGLVLCSLGVILSPRVAFLILEQPLLGLLFGFLAFGLWGMGYNLAAVSYMALATELSGQQGRSKTIAVMFTMMITSIILTSMSLGNMLEVYNPSVLIYSFRVVGLVALFLGMLGLIRLEPRNSALPPSKEENASWKNIFQTLLQNKQAIRFFWYLTILLIAILGQDILLEPFAATAFDMPVDDTTRITAIWGACFLMSMLLGAVMEKKIAKIYQAKFGAWLGVFAFALLVASSINFSLIYFYIGVIVLGLSTGISTVSNLSLMLDMTTPGKVGLYIGAWGMANAISRLAGNMLSGVTRDAVSSISQNAVVGYSFVFVFQILLLMTSLMILQKIDIRMFHQQNEERLSYIEKAAIAGEG